MVSWVPKKLKLVLSLFHQSENLAENDKTEMAKFLQ